MSFKKTANPIARKTANPLRASQAYLLLSLSHHSVDREVDNNRDIHH